MMALKLNHVSKKVPVGSISGIMGVTPDLGACSSLPPPKDPGGRLNIKMPSYQYRDSHVKDKMVSQTVLSRTPGRARQAQSVWDRFIPA